MNNIDKVEQLLLNIINDYSTKNKLVISKVELGSLSNQFERGNGLTLTLDNGKVFEILITEAE